MKIKLTILITAMIIASALIPAGGAAQDAYPAPTPPGHVIGGNEGNGRVTEASRVTDQPDPTPNPYPAPVIEYRQPAALRRR